MFVTFIIILKLSLLICGAQLYGHVFALLTKYNFMLQPG